MILLGSGFTATRGTQPPDVPTPWFSASATDATSRPTPAASITALKSLIVALENLIVAPPFGPVCPRSGRLRPRSLLLSGVSCTQLVATAAWPGNWERGFAPLPKPPPRTVVRAAGRRGAGAPPSEASIRKSEPQDVAGLRPRRPRRASRNLRLTAGAGTPAAFREVSGSRVSGRTRRRPRSPGR